jgi:NAD(P)-dependent dehydrogenase (short-subunit alcohol dehydrogenase family)
MSPPTSPSPDELATCLRVLGALVEDRALFAAVPEDTRRALAVLAGRLSRPERDEVRRFAKALRKQERGEVRSRDEALLDGTGVRTLRRQSVFPTPLLAAPTPAPSATVEEPGPEPAELTEPRKCYVCKEPYRRLHTFYDQLCPPCAQHNWDKRQQTADLSGRVALLTGGRVKIGYHAGMKLLRAGATLLVTTRFPRDAAKRYAAEPDFADFRHRLHVYGLDLLHTPSVERFAEHLESAYPRLDFIVHNACQTVRRPPAYYAHMMDGERAIRESTSPEERRLLEGWESLRGGEPAEGSGALLAAVLSEGREAVGLARPQAFSELTHDFDRDGGDARNFPLGRLDADLQQVDLREKNTWRMTLSEVPTVELLEVHLVNAIAPFVLNGRLRRMMARDCPGDRHIVNVSAMEGQFERPWKTDKHPHTNMAKAALNMMTRTSAQDYAKDGIWMNAVDTGWITDEDPATITVRKREEHGFHPPLDVVDGAARICDPIFHGLRTGEHYVGLFLKDYAPAPW